MLGCVVWQKFRKNVLPPSSESKNKPSMQTEHSASCGVRLAIDPEDGGNTFIQDVDELLSDYTT
jgi:hypothetical protein